MADPVKTDAEAAASAVGTAVKAAEAAVATEAKSAFHAYVVPFLAGALVGAALVHFL